MNIKSIMALLGAVVARGPILGAALLGLVAATGQAGAGVILQDTSTGSAQIEAFEPIGQSFVAEDALVSIALYYEVINSGSPNDPLEFRLYDGAGTGGAILLTQGFNLAMNFDGFFDIDVSAVPLVVGQTYTAAAFIPGNSALWAVSISSANPYAGGETFASGPINNCGSNNDTCDLRFRVTPQGIPEPGTLALFGLGLAGLGFARRKRMI